MADKLLKAAQRARQDMWKSMKNGVWIHGYEYYKPPEEISYRYPAPGSCPLDESDHPNLYKNDWKTPFRNSEYNIARIETKYDDDDPRQATSYISAKPSFDTTGKRGHYDQNILNQQQPSSDYHHVLYENFDPESEEMIGELW